VLYFSDPMDELMVQSLYEVEGKKLKSVIKRKIFLGTEKEKKQREKELKKKEEEYADFLEAAQKKLDQYKRIQLSTRLVDSPACLVTEEHEESPYLQHLPQRGKGGGPKTRRIMELNADPPLVMRLYECYESNADVPQ
jgi:molecular chaperone HtpG